MRAGLGYRANVWSAHLRVKSNGSGSESPLPFPKFWLGPKSGPKRYFRLVPLAVIRASSDGCYATNASAVISHPGPLMMREQRPTDCSDVQVYTDDRNGREFLPNWLFLWHGLRAGDQQGLSH